MKIDFSRWADSWNYCDELWYQLKNWWWEFLPPTVLLWEMSDAGQGEWTCLWMGHFKTSQPETGDVYYAMPEGTPYKVALAKMRALYERGFVGGCPCGCPCGCRGDFEITDKGLSFIGYKREKNDTGY